MATSGASRTRKSKPTRSPAFRQRRIGEGIKADHDKRTVNMEDVMPRLTVFDTPADEVPAPVVKPPGRPRNPENDHRNSCACVPCLIFWDGAEGKALWETWRDANA